MKNIFLRMAAFAAVALASISMAFAQSASSARTDASEPGAALQKYHESILKSVTEIEDARVEAGIETRERADARIAALKARQASCRGECLERGSRTDGRAAPRADGPRGYGRHHDERGHHHGERPRRGCRAPCGV